MEGFDDRISSTTPSNDELLRGSEYGSRDNDTHRLFEEAAGYLLDNKETAPSDTLDEDDILDLAGGARDALERHKAAMPRYEDRPTYTKYSESPPSDPEPEDEQGLGSFADSTDKQTKPMGEMAETATPKTDPKNATKESSSAAVSSYESYFSSSATAQPLMHSSAEGGIHPVGRAEGDGSHHAPVSPLSPLHSPDSLEELSLSDSPSQAPFASVPFGSGPVPSTEAYSKKIAQNKALDEDGRLFEYKTWADDLNVKSGHDKLDLETSRGLNKEGLKEVTYAHIESINVQSSDITAGADLGSKVDQTKLMLCEDSGVASSPEEKLGSSVGSPEDGRMDSDKEGFDRVSVSGESIGLSSAWSPVDRNLTSEPYMTCASSNPTEKSETTYLDSKDNIKPMDTSSLGLFTSKTSWYETEALTGKADSDDHGFLLDMKTSSSTKNPFEGFSPISQSGGGFSSYGEIGSDSQAVKMCESPTPDLVQYAHDELQEANPAKHMEDSHLNLHHKSSDSAKEPSNPSAPLSLSTKEPEDSHAQTSLPDILESSPLSSGKQDSEDDLSEESPDSDHSPVQTIRRKTQHVSVTHSSTNPFAFDANTKITTLKDKTVETGAKGAEMAGHAILPGLDQTFGAFDLVKEVDKNESAPYLQTSVPSKAAPEEYDSDSPNTDSLSPVLEAMAKNPASFQVEAKKDVKESQVSLAKQTKDLLGGLMSDEPEASEEEGFEQEVSSEEFEIIERPPLGSIDEFVEKLDHSKHSKAPNQSPYDDEADVLSNFSQAKAAAGMGSEFQKPNALESSYTLLSQPASTASTEMFGKDLGNPFAPKQPTNEPVSSSRTPVIHLTEEEPKKLAPGQAKIEKFDAPRKASPATGLPNLGAVMDLLYWRDVKKSGVVFGVSLFLLLCLTLCSIVSICSYAALALLSVTITYRVYKGIVQAVQKSEEGHPFKAILDEDVAVSEEQVHKYSELALGRLNYVLRELHRIFLVEDLVDSLKFAVLMWILTYVGALFNGLTLLILGLIAAFSLPVVYEKYQTQIDHYCELVSDQVKDIVAKIQDKVPGMKRKAE
ncbi:hypothetical protein GJAV_G00268230 [Gymnothorax javanicus]|nr:hypothetical protein GJAV_G00268230 [Gymnothorax javanicus]